MKATAKAALSVFGVGHVPPFPGTLASGVAILACWCIFYACPPGWAWVLSGAIGLAFAAATVAWGTKAEVDGGARDPGWIVSDEVAGQVVAVLGAILGTLLAAAPAAATEASAGNGPGSAAGWRVWALAFAAFRVLDIAKPFPIGRLQRVPGGWGILVDDLAAGVVAGAVVTVLAALGVAV